MVDEKVLALRQQQTPGCKKFSSELIAISWTRSFILRLTKSGPNSRDQSVLLLEFEKTMLLYCWLKVYKMWLELICFWLTVSTNREWARIWNVWNHFCLFGTSLDVVGWVWLCKNCNKNWFFIFVWTKRYVPSPSNNIIVGFWSSKGPFKTWKDSVHCRHS